MSLLYTRVCERCPYCIPGMGDIHPLYIPGWEIYTPLYTRVVGTLGVIPGWWVPSVLYPGWELYTVIYPGWELYTVIYPGGGYPLVYTRVVGILWFIPGWERFKPVLYREWEKFKPVLYLRWVILPVYPRWVTLPICLPVPLWVVYTGCT